MATPKIILYKSKTYTDGTHPIMLQVVKNGKAIRTVIARCRESEWLVSKSRVSSKNIMAPKINNDIEVALRDFGKVKGRSFIEYFQSHIDTLKQMQKPSLHSMYKMVFEQILKFRPGVEFDDIDEHFILSFASDLRLRNNKNTIRIKMQVLGRILKMAKKAKLISVNPMDDLTFQKDKSIKNKLSLDDIRKLINAELEGTADLARDIFLSSFYLRGTRVGDVLCLTDKNIQGNRIVFVERKTGKVNNFELIAPLQLIFDKWRGKSKNGYIFDILDIPQEKLKDMFAAKKAITRANAVIRYYLIKLSNKLGIDKNMSMHIARHSFSRIANKTIKDLTVTKDLVGHSSLAIHEAYITEISEDYEMDSYANQVYDSLKPD